MTPFAIIIGGKNDPSADDAKRLLQPVRHLIEDLTAGVVPGAAFAVGVRGMRPTETIESGLLLDHQRRRLVLGDVSLYGAGEEGEAALRAILETFERHGEEGVSGLVGDFAFVIWDWGQRKLIAARDHFGLRLLYFRALPDDGAAVATDIRGLLRMTPPALEVDRDMGLDYLIRNFTHGGRTFFRAIRQIRPGHVLTRRANGTMYERPYWAPTAAVVGLRSYEDYVAEWQSLFQTCVRDRLRTTYPIAAHLSGGLDSRAVVAAAHEIYAVDPGKRPKFYTLSAEFPGWDCDESQDISALVRCFPRFVAERWNGCAANLDDLRTPLVVAPGLRRGLGGGPRRDLEVAQERGARVLLSGAGGDEVFWSGGVFRDLVSRGNFRTMFNELTAFPTWRRAKDHLVDGLKGLLPPRLLSMSRRPSSGRRRRPSWLGPQLVEIFPGSRDQGDQYFPFASHLQRQLWNTLHLPQLTTLIEFSVVAAREAGLEVRMPFLDIRLVRFVSKIPWTLRMPHGDMRRLQRDGVRRLTPEVPIRKTKVIFGTAWARHADANMPLVREILRGQTWYSTAFIDKAAALQLLTEADNRHGVGGKGLAMRQLWTLASFEIWLRTVYEYTAARGSYEPTLS